jgi:hypothetical protein
MAPPIMPAGWPCLWQAQRTGVPFSEVIFCGDQPRRVLVRFLISLLYLLGKVLGAFVSPSGKFHLFTLLKVPEIVWVYSPSICLEPAIAHMPGAGDQAGWAKFTRCSESH